MARKRYPKKEIVPCKLNHLHEYVITVEDSETFSLGVKTLIGTFSSLKIYRLDQSFWGDAIFHVTDYNFLVTKEDSIIPVLEGVYVIPWEAIKYYLIGVNSVEEIKRMYTKYFHPFHPIEVRTNECP